MNRELIMARYGEIALKGRNRYQFENLLVSNIEKTLSRFGDVRVEKVYGRILIHQPVHTEVLDALTRVFGLVSVSKAYVVPLDLEAIKEQALLLAQERGPDTFKIKARRAYKGFDYDSPSINQEVGAHVLRHGPSLRVDVHDPQLTIHVEVRQEGVYLYAQALRAVGGLPVGMTGRAVLLLSGGIDSPVAGWMSMKRGLRLTALHFHSPPFTSEEAVEKVKDLTRLLAGYGGRIPLHLHHFTEVQKAILENCRPQLAVIIMRRMMMRVAEQLAEQEGALAIVTGENLGQVASQTLESIAVTNALARRPVLRPLIGFDKREIMDRAEAIGSYQISIRPYDDCCTLFVPKHPQLFPRLQQVQNSERNLRTEELLAQAGAKSQCLWMDGWEPDGEA